MNYTHKQTHTQITHSLKAIIDSDPQSIRAAVAHEALEQEDIQSFFKDLLNHGCQSGMIGSLIYYQDTGAFFDHHYSEIEELRQEYKENTGEDLPLTGDLKNCLAWFGFEETAYRIAVELGLED